MSKRQIVSMAAAMVITASAAFGAVKENTFTLSPLIGGYVFDSDQSLEPALMLGIRGGYNFTKNFAVEALYDYANTSGSSGPLTNISLHRFGADALYHFFPEDVFVPYLAGGFSGLKFTGDGVGHQVHGAFDYGLGAKYFLNDEVAIRGDVRHILYSDKSDTMNHVEFSLGLHAQFGAPPPPAKAVAPEPAPAPAPEPVAKVVEPEPTPPPAAVAAVVVPVVIPPSDKDGDGVIDTLDKCADTPSGVAVDGNGCPVDTDKDGVADYLDKCPGTPAGVAVDGSGCPVDSDKDGVADYLDKCPATPAGAAVDKDGCPLDTDKDGVADYLDKCPETPAGIAVDVKGCPVEAAKQFCDKPAVIAVSFDSNKTEVKSKYHDELDKVGNFLKTFPASKGTIEGHTDADGNKDANQKLSKSRAENVRSYIINKFGIDGSRITAVGHGSSKPVASNKNAAGKAKNRRIEAIFSCE